MYNPLILTEEDLFEGSPRKGNSMRRLASFAIVAIPVIFLGVARGRANQRNQQANERVSTETPASESPATLRQLILDILNSMESLDDAKTSTYFSNLTIPDHGEWFLKVFGTSEGPRLDAKYSDLLPKGRYDITRSLKHLTSEGNKNIEVNVSLLVPDPNARLMNAIAAAASQPIAFYEVNGSRLDEKAPTFIGYFVYVDHGFRYMDLRIFHAYDSSARSYPSGGQRRSEEHRSQGRVHLS
jgi:hypothetical protein